MSGIFGIVNNSEKDTDLHENAGKMLLWNRAYGRENEEVYEGNNTVMGCCYEKLSKDAVSTSPVIRNEQGYSVVDSLLYNHAELHKKCNLETELSDEELLLYNISKFGLDSLKDVNGDFCGAVYNEQQNTLILFRDHMGVRPLFYYAGKEFVAFSTDIRGLLALKEVDPSIDEDWVYRQIAGYSVLSLECTEYKHIFCVKPGTYMTFSFEDGVKIKTNRYWKLGSNRIRYASFDEYKDELRELVTDSIQRRLDAVSGTVGAELSGGLDSGVIDILIHRLGRECVYHSWSADPAEVPFAENDERLVVEDICKQEGITCNYSKMKSEYGMDSNIARNMQELGFDLNEEESYFLLYAFPAYINTMPICDTCECMRQNGVKVVFTGHGGDEGVSHRCNPYELFYHHEYFHFTKQLWSATYGKKNRFIKALKSCYKILGRTRRKFSKPFQGPFRTPELLNKNFADKFYEKEMPVLHFAYSPTEYIQDGGSRNRLDVTALLGAYNGIRYLFPYLDYRVIDFAVSIPRYLYIKGTNYRYLFREAFKDIMPESLYTLRTKEDNSRKNYPENTEWYESFKKQKMEVYQTLDRKVWGQFLNFDEIDAWIQRGKPEEEKERWREESILINLYYCAMAQNLVEKARSQTPDEKVNNGNSLPENKLLNE